MNAIKNAGQVLSRTSEYLESGLVSKQPSWYKVLANHPPLYSHVKRVRPEQLKQVKQDEVEALKRIMNKQKDSTFFKTRLKPKQLGSSFLTPQKLHFIEDDLRELFFKQHPWELADAKSLIENERNLDIGKLDWSTMRQYNKKLDGESVVQRTLYLVKNQGKTLLEAYEQSKYEYYRLKIEDETEMNVAQEESEMFGAVYGKSMVEYGFDHEMEVLSKWKKDAIEETRVMEAKRANSSSGGLGRQENKEVQEEIEEEHEDEEVSEEDIFKELKNSEKKH